MTAIDIARKIALKLWSGSVMEWALSFLNFLARRADISSS